MTDELPVLADALPGAQRACALAVAHLGDDSAPPAAVVPALVRLLEAAGGPDVGNAVRAHLERYPARLPEQLGTDEPRRRVLRAAGGLHRAALDDLARALTSAGLTRQDPARSERAAYAERVLAARHEAVDAVLVALAQEDAPALSAVIGTWAEALFAAP